MLNDSTRKTVFNAKWSFEGICFNVDEKPLGDYTYSDVIILVSYMNFRKMQRPQEAKMATFDDTALT